jgi:hypothetical protein
VGVQNPTESILLPNGVRETYETHNLVIPGASPGSAISSRKGLLYPEIARRRRDIGFWTTVHCLW